jgi:hypothetical protein
MNDMPPQKARRIAFIISGIIDAILGGILLLIGFGFLPFDVTEYGMQSWHVNLLGGVLFLLGVVTFAYNLSRLEE